MELQKNATCTPGSVTHVWRVRHVEQECRALFTVLRKNASRTGRRFTRMPQALCGGCYLRYTRKYVAPSKNSAESSFCKKCRAKRSIVTLQKGMPRAPVLERMPRAITWRFSEFRAQPSAQYTKQMLRAPFSITENAARTI